MYRIASLSILAVAAVSTATYEKVFYNSLKATVCSAEDGNTAMERVKAASYHPDLLPIPEYVMNDTLRDWVPTDESAYFYPFSNGDYDNLLFSE